jgi:hypothetical protein
MLTKQEVLGKVNALAENLDGLNLIVHLTAAKDHLVSASTHIARARSFVDANDPWRALDCLAEASRYLDAAAEIHKRKKK